MPFCNNCGTEINIGTKFCTGCGTQQESRSEWKAGVRQMSKEDCYDVLGIPRYSSVDEVKRAYRQLAVVYHPDKNPGDASASEKFRYVTDACKTLLNIKENFMPFCTNCGADITEDLKFCLNCGIPLDGGQRNIYQANSEAAKPDIPQVMYALSNREAVCSVFWIIVAGLQALFVILAICFGHDIKSIVIIGIISILNFKSGFSGLKFSKIILSDYPAGIAARYGEDGLGAFIWAMGYNGILFVWNIIDGSPIFAVICGLATAVAVFDLLFIRNFARSNWMEIDEYVSQFDVEDEE